ncbi:hypothetical protein VaNZ11_005903, partial [Volvox africanus]
DILKAAIREESEAAAAAAAAVVAKPPLVSAGSPPPAGVAAASVTALQKDSSSGSAPPPPPTCEETPPLPLRGSPSSSLDSEPSRLNDTGYITTPAQWHRRGPREFGGPATAQPAANINNIFLGGADGGGTIMRSSDPDGLYGLE